MTLTLAPELSSATEPVVPPAPFSVTPSSSLIEDIAGWNEVVVNTKYRNVAEPVAHYQMAGTWRAAIIVDGQYQTLSRNVGSAMWKLEPGPAQAAGCLAVVAVQEEASLVWTLAIKEKAIAVLTDAGTGLRHALDIAGTYKKVQVSYTPAMPTRVPIVSMADAQGNLVLYVIQNGSWTRHQFDVKGVLNVAATMRTVALTPQHFVIGVGGPQAFSIDIDLSRTQPVSPPHYDTSIPANARVAGGYQLDWANARFVYSDGSGVYVQHRDRCERLPGDWPYGAQAATDERGMLHVYLKQDADDDQRLSVLHQVDWTADGPVWMSTGNVPTPIPLTLWVHTVLCDPMPRSTAGIMALTYPSWTPERMMTLRVLTQDPLTGTWTDEEVRTESQNFQRLPRWRTQALLLDAAGAPVGGHSVRVRSMSTCTVWVQGRPYTVGPRDEQAIDVQTDARGAVSFAIDAASLTPPSLLLTADGLAEEVELRPAKPVQDYFTGTTTLPGKPLLTGEVLRTAETDGKPLIPDWPQGLSPDQVVTMMKSSMAMADPNLPQPRSAAYVLQTTDPTQPAFQEFETAEELRAAREHWMDAPDFGGFWDRIGHFLGDVAHAVTSGAAKVGRIVLDVGKRAVEIMITVQGRLVSLGEFVIHTVRDAIRAVEAVWRAVGAFIQDVLAWLRDLLISRDVFDTAAALESGLVQMPGFLREQLNLAGRYTDGFFGRQKEAVHARIAELKTFFNGQSLADQPYLGTAMNQYLGHVPGFSLLAETQRPSCLWLAEKVVDAARNLDEPTPAHEPLVDAELSAGIQEAWQTFVQRLEASSGAFKAALDDVGMLLRNLVGDVSLPALMQLQISTLLNLVDHLVDALLDLCDAMLQALLTLVGQALSGIEVLLRTEVNLGPLQALIDFMARLVGQDAPRLTVAGLLSLVVAFPATLSWKVLHGPNAKLFPGGHLPQDVTTGAVAPGFDGNVPSLDGFTKYQPCAHFGAVLGFADGIVETGLDVVAPATAETPLLVTGALAVASVGEALMNWPSERGVPFVDKLDFQSPGQCAWLIGLLGPIFDIAPRLAGMKLGRNMDPAGQWALCGIGTAASLLGFIDAVTSNDPWAWKMSSVLEPLGDALQPLRSASAIELTAGLSFTAKPVIDLLAIALPAAARGIEAQAARNP